MLNNNEIAELQQLLKCITLHWTGGTYSQTFEEYHFCIPYANNKATAKQTLSLKQRGAHTWRRNTGNIGISICAMYDGYPVKPQQKEVMAKLVAELCLLFKINPRGTYVAHKINPQSGEQLPETFDAPTVTDHRYYAEKDGYPGLRFDIRSELLGKPGIITLDEIYHKSLWYYDKLVSGEIQREYTTNLF